MTGIFRRRSKSNVMFDSHHGVRGQFILINWEWLIRRHSTGASITIVRHWAELSLGNRELGKYIAIKTCFVPELHRPHGQEFQWTSGADRDRDSPRRRRPPRRHLLRRQAETFSEQVRPGERSERRGEQTAEREQSWSLSLSNRHRWGFRDPDDGTQADTFSAETYWVTMEVMSQLRRQGPDTSDHGKCNEWTSNQGFQGSKEAVST